MIRGRKPGSGDLGLDDAQIMEPVRLANECGRVPMSPERLSSSLTAKSDQESKLIGTEIQVRMMSLGKPFNDQELGSAGCETCSG